RRRRPNAAKRNRPRNDRAYPHIPEFVTSIGNRRKIAMAARGGAGRSELIKLIHAYESSQPTGIAFECNSVRLLTRIVYNSRRVGARSLKFIERGSRSGEKPLCRQ